MTTEAPIEPHGESDPVVAIGLRLVPVPAGVVLLHDEGSRRSWPVRVDAFLLDPTPVTGALWRAVTGAMPVPGSGATSGSTVPVTDVSWADAIGFCNQLSLRLGLRPCYVFGADPELRDVTWDRAADGFRLPSEAEWEFACRAGSSAPRYGPLDDIAWHAGNAGGGPCPVGTRQPNAWGLHDMIGNAWEWCWDLYDPQVYGPYRVFRGGGWADPPWACRASCRRKSHPTYKNDDLGLRLARSPSP